MMEDKKTIYGIVIDSEGDIIIPTGGENKFFDNVEQLADKVKSYSITKDEDEKLINDACLGIERFFSWKKQYYEEGVKIPQEILQELVPAIEYTYEKEKNFK